MRERSASGGTLANIDERDESKLVDADGVRTPAVTRRDVARMAAGGLGAVAIGAVLPRQWVEPLVQVAFLPAHAAGTQLPSSVRLNGTRVDVRTLQPAPQEVAPASDPGAPPTDAPPPSGSGATPPEEPEPNPEPSGGGETGSDTQPESDAPAGQGAPPCDDPIPAPSDIAITPTSNSAIVMWNGNGERSFEVEVYNYGTETLVAKMDSLGTIKTLTGLQPCTQYQVVIRARRCGTMFGSADSASFRTLMDTTLQPSLTIPENYVYCDGIYVQWNNIPCAQYYEVQIAEQPGGEWLSTTVSGYPATLLYGLCPNKTYKVRVRAVGSGGSRGQWSTEATRTTKTVDSNGKPCSCSGSSQSEST